MNESTRMSRDRLVADLKALMADTEELLRLTAGEAGDRAGEVRGRLLERLSGVKDRVGSIETVVTERTREAARATDDYVRENPWQAVGMAAGAAFLLGVLLGRR